MPDLWENSFKVIETRQDQIRSDLKGIEVWRLNLGIWITLRSRTSMIPASASVSMVQT